MQLFGNTNLPQTYQKHNTFFTSSLIFHFRPRAIPVQALKFTQTFGLGGMSLILIMLLFITGVMLKFVYEPFPGRAYDSIIILNTDVLFGRLIRNIHHFSANFLIITVFLHMLRVFFTGGFHYPRQFNWIMGICLFFGILASNFTGYLLPWDQLSYWAITICTSMLEYIPVIGSGLQKMIRGGSEIGPASLRIFFTFHTAIIPALLVVLFSFHFFRIRKTGGIILPRSSDNDSDKETKTVPAFPNLMIRELTVALALIAFILIFSIIFNAPIGDKANPGLSPNPAKAPWYFLGLQEILLHFHPVFAILIIPAVILTFLTFLPYIKYNSNSEGIWFCSQKGRRMGIVSFVIALVITPIGILCDEFFMNSLMNKSGIPAIIGNGLIPAGFLLAGIIIYYVLMKKKWSCTTNDAVQAIFILLIVSLMIMTITGIWFRGEGMALTWPWNYTSAL